ncbi:MAG: DUF1343 domain-containing protein, partial [Myxococcota bacterium]
KRVHYVTRIQEGEYLMTPKVQTGLDRLCAESFASLRGRRVGICCNPTTVNASLQHIVTCLKGYTEVSVVALFGPEHGIFADAQDMIEVSGTHIDATLNVPVYSLYGSDEASLRPKPEMLEGIDLLLFDIQDVGSRYYTYVYTMAFLMEAAGRAGIEVWVLDRPNPINGLDVEGSLIQEGFHSFVGQFSLANRHGLTSGELALMFRDAFGISCTLKVIEMEGWKRTMWYDQTGLPWVMPSPNMPTLDTATVYPGGCLWEGTNLSEGRGTTRPFELVGAPYLDAYALCERLAGFDLPGVDFRPVGFLPTFQKWGKEACAGVQLHVTDRSAFRPFLTGVALICAARALSPESFAWRTQTYEFVSDRLAIDLLLGGTTIREAIEQGESLSNIAGLWEEEEGRFRAFREDFLLYS